MDIYYFVIYILLHLNVFQFQIQSIKTNEIPHCILYNSSVEVITTYEERQFYQSVEISVVQKDDYSITCFPSNIQVAKVVNITKTSVHTLIDKITVYLKMKRLGSSNINCVCQSKFENHTFEILTLIVEREITLVEIIFRVAILFFVVVITFVMGCSVDMKIILQYIKKPIAPSIGLLSQYVIMPLLAFAISKIVNMSNEFGFGLLTVGCCPGGSGSNIWTVLLKGDLNLSMTMTFISTIFALALMPFWMFCLGRYFVDYSLIKIPYLYIFFNLIQVVVPVILGLLVRWKWEQKALKIIKITKFLAIGFIVFLLTFGIYANWYMYVLIFDYPYLIPIASMLPWLGFLFGFLTGIITFQGITRSLTISIETGIQNIGIAILILKFSMPKPLGDLAAVVPIIVACVTTFPLMFAFIADSILTKCLRKKSKKKNFEHSLSDLPIQPTYMMVDVVEAKEIPKQSTIEPTLYYSEELSSYFGESSPSLG